MKAGANVLGMDVRSEDGRRLGHVTDLLFDDGCTRVVGLVMRSGYVFRTRHVVGFGDVQEIRPTVVIVGDPNSRESSADKVAAPESDGRSMQGRPVLTRLGRYVGAIRDVLFDEETGRVVGFEVAYPAARKPRRRTGVPADLASVVPDAVIVADGGPVRWLPEPAREGGPGGRKEP